MYYMSFFFINPVNKTIALVIAYPDVNIHGRDSTIYTVYVVGDQVLYQKLLVVPGNV